MDTWVSTECPKCHTKNRCNLGDQTDFTAVDVDGIICLDCNWHFLLDADLFAFRDFVHLNRPFESDEEEYAYDEDGQLHTNLLTDDRQQRMFREHGRFEKGVRDV